MSAKTLNFPRTCFSLKKNVICKQEITNRLTNFRVVLSLLKVLLIIATTTSLSKKPPRIYDSVTRKRSF